MTRTCASAARWRRGMGRPCRSSRRRSPTTPGSSPPATAKRTSPPFSASRRPSSGTRTMAERPGFYLPDFCRAQSVLAVILIAALVALLFTLARHGISAKFWTDLASISLFLLWAALGTAAAWCAARGLLSRQDVPTGSAIALVLALAVTVLVTEGA